MAKGRQRRHKIQSKLLVFLIDSLVETTDFALEVLQLFVRLVEALVGVYYLRSSRFRELLLICY